jgi:7-carboxy-7-deazaguanine synthase
MSTGPKGIDRYPKQDTQEEETLLVNEIYCALDGEGPWQGYPVTIVRLMGCNLRCGYCDSQFAYSEGRKIEAASIMEIISKLGINKILITGGEPLAQRGTTQLLERLLEGNFEVSLETNGSYPVDNIPARVVKIVDVKTPDSGSGGSFQEDNLEKLGNNDCMKFVISSRNDYEWSRDFLARHENIVCETVFTPVWRNLIPQELAGWILEDCLDVRFSVQLHKILWGDQRGV